MDSRPAIEEVLAEQRRYYRARAAEYDDWWQRRGRYAHGPEADERWFSEIEQLEDALTGFGPCGRVLELACGTGLWTAKLAGLAASVTALDSSPEVIELARSRVLEENVRFIETDIFAWEPEDRYDACFFSFWLSHVPAGMIEAFWAKVASSLAPGGRVFLIDSARSSRASARDHVLAEEDEELSRRRLDDGREYTIVKHWFDSASLQRQIDGLGWHAQISSSGEFFVYGQASPP